MRLHVWPEKKFARAGVDFRVYAPLENGRPGGVGLPLVMKTSGPEDVCDFDPGPTFTLRDDQVQELMDRLWDLGFRPSEGTGSAGALKQAEEHIKSLQRIAFALVQGGKS
jgi:hypothetical protein